MSIKERMRSFSRECLGSLFRFVRPTALGEVSLLFQRCYRKNGISLFSLPLSLAFNKNVVVLSLRKVCRFAAAPRRWWSRWRARATALATTQPGNGPTAASHPTTSFFLHFPTGIRQHGTKNSCLNEYCSCYSGSHRAKFLFWIRHDHTSGQHDVHTSNMTRYSQATRSRQQQP